jgi:tRNA 2-thiouridine synthesizing protein E
MTIVKNAEMECFNPEITREIEISSNKYIVNDRYYLMDFSAWDDQIRDWLANKEGIVIGNEHLHVINHLRYLYSQNKRHPASRAVTSDLSMKFGAEKGTTRYFHTLFPKGIHQAYLIAGIPMQDSCC